MNKKAEGAFEGIFGIFVLIFIFCSIFVSEIGATKGQHTGYITAIESQSFITQDTLVSIKSSTESTQEDVYCVTDQVTNLQTLLKEAQSNQSRVTITYQNSFIMWRWDCSRASTIIRDVEVQ